MRRILLYTAGIITPLFLLLNTPIANAHVLITDTTEQIGAILHVQPDDDPIAGTEDTLFFDIQNKNLPETISNINLTITDAQGKTQVIPTTSRKNTVSAKYTFPAQGLYTLTLSLQSAQTPYQFVHAQRVARGSIPSDESSPRFIWAEITLVVTGCVALGLLILYCNRRSSVKMYTNSKK